MLKFVHSNFLVSDMEKSLEFYEKILNFKVVSNNCASDEEYWIVHLKHPSTNFKIELTSYPKQEYKEKIKHELQGEYHIAFMSDKFNDDYNKHKNLGIIVYENLDWNLYFISDPDGHWIEIINGDK